MPLRITAHLSAAFLAILATASAMAQSAVNEEVLFFDGSPGQTATENGGTVIYPLDTGQWRFWYQDVYHAAVSPDGRTVAYRYQNSINIADVDGRNPKTIVFDMPGTPLIWSPLGDRIAFFMFEGEKVDESDLKILKIRTLVIMDLDGNVAASYAIPPDSLGQSPRGSATGTEWPAPSWSPDGSKIAFAADTGAEPPIATTIYTINVATGATTKLYEPIRPIFTGIVESLGMPVWSPKGDKIAVNHVFNQHADSKFANNVAVIPASGGAPKLLTSLPTADNPTARPFIPTKAWSPDGSELAFAVHFVSGFTPSMDVGLYRIPANGGAPQWISGFVPFSTYDEESLSQFPVTRSGFPTALQWTILNPTGVRIEILLPSPYGGVDVPTEATIKLTLLGMDPVTVEFPNGLLTTDDEELFDIIVADVDTSEAEVDGSEEGDDSPVEEIESVELTPAEPVVTFDALIIPKKFGAADLIVDALAMIDGELEVIQIRETLTVPPLLVTLRALPLVDDEPIVNMTLIEGENEGEFIVKNEAEEEIEPKVEVTVTNLSDESVKALLQGVDPRARDKSAVVGRIETAGEFPVELKQDETDEEGIIGPGESVVHEVDLNLFEDGRFEFVATVTGFFVDKPEATFATAKNGAPIAVGEPYPVELELDFVRTPVITDQNNGAFLVQPGASIQVIASVNNLTSNSTLQFYGIRAIKTLNVLVAHLTSEEGRAYNPNLPFVHDHTVDANASVILGGNILTSVDGAGSGIVEWLGLEDARLIDDATEEENELTADDVLIRSKVGGWLGDDLTVRIIQDRSRPDAPSLTAAQQVAIYGHGAMIGMGEWTYDTFDAIGGIGRLAGTISADPSLLADAWGEASRAVWELAQMVGETWSEMTPEEKEEFVQSVVGEVQRRLFLLSIARSPVTAEDSAAVLNWTRDATFVLFGGVEEAYASDDPARIAEMWGRVHGHVAMEVLTAAISEIKFTKYVKGAELSKLAKNNALGPALNNQEAALRAIKSGPLDDSTVLAAFGPGEKDLRDFEDVFRAFKVKGYARERSPLANLLINIREVAVWKPEAMKPKGISDIDLLLLGKNHPVLDGADGDPINLQGITAIFYPGDDAAVLKRLDGQTPEVIEACLARAAKRREEFHDFYPEFGKWADGDGIPVPRNFKDNGIPDPAGQGDPTRDFEVEVIVRTEDGPTLFIPKMANKDGLLRYISGDIDWVHFSFLDGTPLDPDTARKLYTVLMDCCGLQHPETVTWIKNGQAVFKAKANQLAEFVRGEKALLEVSGEGARAVRISERLTRFATNGRNHLIFFENGLKSRIRATVADIETAFATLKPSGSSGVVLPFLWYAKSENPVDDTSLNGNDWIFTTADDDAQVLRQRNDGLIEFFDGINWLPWNAPETASQTFGSQRAALQSDRLISFSDHVISLSPLTTLTSDAEAGDESLSIFDLPEAWPVQLEGRVDQWFAVGDSIVIAPGDLSQEVRAILDLDPILLDSPLQYDHPAGTTVAVIPGNMTVAEVTDTASELITTVDENGLTTLIWSSLPDHRYTLEYESAPGEWIALQEDLDADSIVITVTLPSEEYDPEGDYRLHKTGVAPKPLEITAFTVDPIAGTLELAWIQQPAETYLVEVSETLRPGSWGTLLPEFYPIGTDARTILPISSSASSRRFYRIRSNDEMAGASEESILAMNYDEPSETITVTWATVPNEQYQLESAAYDSPDAWESAGEAVTASGESAFLILPAGVDTHSRIYRVRRIE